METSRERLAKILEPEAWAASRLRCGDCGERIYYSEFAGRDIDAIILFGESLRSLILARHAASNHYVGTAKELEDNNAPIPGV